MRAGQLSAFIQLLTMDGALLKLWYADGALLRHDDSVRAASRAHTRAPHPPVASRARRHHYIFRARGP